MWLPIASLSPEETIAEFDQWITPSLGDIRDTEKFVDEASTLSYVLAAIAREMEGNELGALAAARAFINESLTTWTPAEAEERLAAALTALFLVTAKSDNAVKCQYPIWFRARHGEHYPIVRARRVQFNRVPTVVKSTDIVKQAVRLSAVDDQIARNLLDEYVGFLLSDDKDENQLAALVDAFASAESKAPGNGLHLLAPLVAFQIRGSVAASGGHDPEQIVRDYLVEWGLEPGIHFNLNDITAGALSDWLVEHGDTTGGRTIQVASTDKTRAFDFVLPCFQPMTHRRIFVQSQFYAGDSGSVSHKNVDQAGAARSRAAHLFPDARFVELVDGAGYCASLRQDLRHLLFAPDTDDFVQLRSIPIRLRRILQQSDVVTPLDVALRVAEGVTQRADLEADLAPHLPDGMTATAAIAWATQSGWLEDDGALLKVGADKHEVVVRYGLLDEVVASSTSGFVGGSGVIVPGYGADYGTGIDPSWDANALDQLISQGNLIRVGQP